MKHNLILGTALLTISGLVCRLIGFFYRVFLSRVIGAEGMGLYQLILPVYHLSYAFCVAGIQTSLSRLIAAAHAKKEYTKATLTFLSGTFLSFTASVFISILLQWNSVFLSNSILGNGSCVPFIKWLALSLPFGALHGCIIGWYMGKKQVHIPAGMQVSEELIRLAATYLCYRHFLNQNLTPSPTIAFFGLFIAEITSVLVSLFFLYNAHLPIKKKQNLISLFSTIKELITHAFPLTINRVSLNLMHSVEAFLIPLSLQQWGMKQNQALETLGTVNGMALPLVLFPTAIINALSSVLLPTISENQALENNTSIRRLIKKTSLYSFFIGLFCIIFFSLFGRLLGGLFYHNETAGEYISILSIISPFLFINIIFASIMNGIGKTYLCFLVNFINMCIRISCIYFLIPNAGIFGYFIGLIGGEILCTAISILIIYHIIFHTKPLHAKDSIDK